MTTTESYGCDKHGEDAYQGCALRDLEALRSRLAEVEAEHAAFSNNVEQCEKENDRLRAWQRRAIQSMRWHAHCEVCAALVAEVGAP